MTKNKIKTLLAKHGFAEGRMISSSKTRYCECNRNRFVVFNAQGFTARCRILRQVDLDLTLDSEKLAEAARKAGENFFVLYERSASPSWKPAEKSNAAVLREAVFWTRTRARDQDRFIPFTAGRSGR